MIDNDTVLKIDQWRMKGASAADVLEALMEAGVESPEETFQAYAQTPLGDGRLRSQVNLGDPAEWE